MSDIPGKRGMTGKHGNHKGKPRSDRIQITCQNCGIQFEKLPSFIVQHPSTKYCSRKCSGEASRVDSSKTTVVCAECGAEFRKRTDHLKERNYCSRGCSDKGRAKYFLLKLYGDSGVTAKWRNPEEIKK